MTWVQCLELTWRMEKTDSFKLFFDFHMDAGRFGNPHPKMVWAKKEETFNFHLLNDRTWAVTTKFLSCFKSLKNIRSNTSQENRHFKFSYGIKSYKRQRNALHLSIRSRDMKRLQFGVAWALVCVCLQIHKLNLVLTGLKQLTRTFNNLLVNSKKLVLYQSQICI